MSNEEKYTYGFSSTTSTTATTCLDTVFLEVREIGMTWSRVEIHGAIPVVLWPLVLIQYQHPNWSPKSNAEFGAGLDHDLVLFVSRCCQGALPGSPSSHLGLDICLSERHARRTAIHDTAH